MTTLLPEQADALRDIQAVCRDLNVDIVVIGAAAYRAWVQDEHRSTEDVDTVAGTGRMGRRLSSQGRLHRASPA